MAFHRYKKDLGGPSQMLIHSLIGWVRKRFLEVGVLSKQ